jgi:ketosteroid isomerase-like protein
MSEANVEITRSAYAAFNRGDIEALLAIFDPDIEFNSSDVFFDQPRTYRGLKQWQEEFLSDLMEVFEAYQVNPEEVIDAGDQVLSIVQAGGPGKLSGAETSARLAHLAAFRDGKIVRFTEFKDVAEAREVAGLSE